MNELVPVGRPLSVRARTWPRMGAALVVIGLGALALALMLVRWWPAFVAAGGTR